MQGRYGTIMSEDTLDTCNGCNRKLRWYTGSTAATRIRRSNGGRRWRCYWSVVITTIFTKI